MSATTNFDDWLDEADLSDYEEIYSLYCAVRYEEDYAFWVSKRGPNGLFVRTDGMSSSLWLVSDKAKDTFLALLQSRYCREMGMEEWYAFERSMRKED